MTRGVRIFVAALLLVVACLAVWPAGAADVESGDTIGWLVDDDVVARCIPSPVFEAPSRTSTCHASSTVSPWPVRRTHSIVTLAPKTSPPV